MVVSWEKWVVCVEKLSVVTMHVAISVSIVGNRSLFGIV